MKYILIALVLLSTGKIAFGQQYGCIQLATSGVYELDFSKASVSANGVELGYADENGLFYPQKKLPKHVTVTHPSCKTKEYEVLSRKREACDEFFLHLKKSVTDSITKAIHTNFVAHCSIVLPDSVDVNAEFPGGKPELKKFLAEHLNYPQDALELEKTGRVYVTFVVDSDGHLQCTEIAKGAMESMNEEALRVVNSFPAFVPAQLNGKPVAFRFWLPVTFMMM